MSKYRNKYRTFLLYLDRRTDERLINALDAVPKGRKNRIMKASLAEYFSKKQGD